jgi:GntR family transcriptional regulator, rspAB operon transcriptional repressor
MRPTARDIVSDALRREIVRGELPVGEKLNPGELAERFAVSPTPAREALQLLASEGLVRIDPFRGARVAPLSADEYEELYLMRVGLEALAARLGAEGIADADVAELERELDELDRAAADGDLDRFYEHDRRFHLIHYGAAGRPGLVARIMSLRTASERYARQAYAGMKDVGMGDTVVSHRRIVEAVRVRDGAAAERAIRDDLERTLATFSERLAEEPEPLKAARG